MAVIYLGNAQFQGLSTDTKPTTGPVNSSFLEIDTGIIWSYRSSVWSLPDINVWPNIKKRGAWYGRNTIGNCDGVLTGLISVYGTQTFAVDNLGTYTKPDTGTGAAAVAGFRFINYFTRYANPWMQAKFSLNQTTVCRFFLGWSNPNASPTSVVDYLALNYGIGLWYDSAVSANWKIMSNNGGASSTLVDLGQGATAADTSIHTLTITGNDTPSFTVQLDNATVKTVTTPLPTQSVTLGILAYVDNVAAVAAKTYSVWWYKTQLDPIT